MTSFTHALAHDLIGFKTSTLRVRVLDSNELYVWVITADLLDAGTRLVLDQKQIEPILDDGQLMAVGGVSPIVIDAAVLS